ncbi:MAG: GNAT family N-acetyltransferase, partial [Roseovarius sp.]
MGFDPQPTLEGATLLLRPLHADDLEPLYKAASDPATWAGHPVTNRHERAVFEPYFQLLLESRGTLAVTDKVTGEVIGCSRYYEVLSRPGTMAIGYTFLRCDYWG